MRLVHFSPEPVAAPRSTDYATQSVDPNYFKPRGLWVSDEDEYENGQSWLSWSKAERFRLDHFKHAYEVTVTDEPGAILYLRSVEEIDQFTQTYGIKLDYERKIDDELPMFRNRFSYCDWPRLATVFKGLIITPYQWERRLDGGANWYYTWDCASGCIWDATAITGWREIDPPDMSEALDEEAKAEAERAELWAKHGWKTTEDMLRGTTKMLQEATAAMQQKRDAVVDDYE